MNRVQRPRERLASLHQMPQIRPRIPPAHHALARRIGRPLVLGIPLALDVHSPFAGKQQPMPRRPRRQHAVHHVHPQPRVLLNLVRIPHPHHVPRLVLGQQRQHLRNHLQRQLPRLAHAQPANRVPVEIHLHQLFRALPPQIPVHPALHNSKQALRAPLKLLPPNHLIAMRAKIVERPSRPRHRQPQALLRSRPVRRILRALVERHRNIRSQCELNID